jgi:hypothetical protein
MTTEKPTRPSRKLFQLESWRTRLPHFLTRCGLAAWPFLIWILSASGANAQSASPTNAVKLPLSSNRYLIIVETSRGMGRRTEGTLKAVGDLFVSMRKQLHRGDTIGVWTYNDQLYAGRFPLQQWTPETHRAIVTRVLNYLKEQPYEKSAKLDSALTVMDKIIKGSSFITVFLVSDGEQPIRGTPFDDNINATYKSWKQEQNKAHMPFVTMLRANKGQITDHSVTSSPWTVELPALPLDAIPVAIVTNTPPAPAPKPAPIVPPLIVSGRKKTPPPTAPADAASNLTQPQAAALTPTESASSPGSNAPNPPLPVPAAESASPRPTTALVDPVIGNPAKSLTTPAEPAPPTEANPSSVNPTTTATATRTNANEQKAASASLPSSAGPLEQTPEKKPAVAENEPASTAPLSSGNLVPFFGQRTVIIIGLVIASIVLGLSLMVVRRSRPAPHTSLITRSFDRENK